jgi:Flp pilus assembly protein TadG
MRSRYRQTGLATVEFAITGAALMFMIFGTFEIGRGFYTAAMLDEITRRGARLAAVCPVNDPAISRLAIMNASGDSGASRFVNGLTPANIVIDYLDSNGSVVNTPADPSSFLQIRYVRARVTGFTYQVSVPFVAGLSSLLMPEFEHIIPRESLGIPREGATTPC